MHIILSPDIALDAEQFAELWQADEEAQQIASASLESQQQQFAISPEVMVALSFVGSVAGAAVTTAVTETTKHLIQKWFAEKKPDEAKPELEVLEKKMEDGTTMLVVVVKS